MTRKSKNIEDQLLGSILPAKLVDRNSWSNSMISSSHADKGGALLLRRVRVGGQSDYVKILARVRYRPEAGEGKSGRKYLQARLWVIEKADWIRHAGGAILRCAMETLQADPDSTSQSRTERMADEPLTLDLTDYQASPMCSSSIGLTIHGSCWPISMPRIN